MASFGDYNFLSASANDYSNQLSGQFGSISNDFRNASAFLSAPLKPNRAIGRAVPSYSTHISGNSIPSYSTHIMFNNNQHTNKSNSIKPFGKPLPSYVQRAARQPLQTHTNFSASKVAHNAATMVRRNIPNNNISNFVDSASVIPFNSASMGRRQALSTSASIVSRHVPNFSETQVPLNHDPNPILIKKKPSAPIHYTQNISVKVCNKINFLKLYKSKTFYVFFFNFFSFCNPRHQFNQATL
jgi:hypothetical protein